MVFLEGGGIASHTHCVRRALGKKMERADTKDSPVVRSELRPSGPAVSDQDETKCDYHNVNIIMKEAKGAIFLHGEIALKTDRVGGSR